MNIQDDFRVVNSKKAEPSCKNRRNAEKRKEKPAVVGTGKRAILLKIERVLPLKIQSSKLSLIPKFARNLRISQEISRLHDILSK